MPEIKKPVAGTFCWVELNTTDTSAAKKFYTALFEWSVKEMPLPDGSTYAMLQHGGKNVAGLTTLKADAQKMGAPPNWLSYVAVDDTDATAAKATKLGGRVLAGPFDVMEAGRMAVVADPTGGVLALWKAGRSEDPFLYGEPGALCWNELLTADTKGAEKFYTSLIGWQCSEMSMGPGTYHVLKVGETMAGGLMEMPKDMKGAPPAWVPYFSVGDADATVAKAQKLGGKALVPPTDIPNIGRFAWLQDPQGAVVAILKAIPPAK